jgi:hypothetical protein
VEFDVGAGHGSPRRKTSSPQRRGDAEEELKKGSRKNGDRLVFLAVEGAESAEKAGRKTSSPQRRGDAEEELKKGEDKWGW